MSMGSASSDAPRVTVFPLRFYFGMALLICSLVAYGFSFTLDKRLLHAQPAKPWIVWAHAVVFFGWVAFFTTQTALVNTRNIRAHRRIGLAGLVFGVLIPIVG